MSASTEHDGEEELMSLEYVISKLCPADLCGLTEPWKSTVSKKIETKPETHGYLHSGVAETEHNAKMEDMYKYLLQGEFRSTTNKQKLLDPWTSSNDDSNSRKIMASRLILESAAIKKPVSDHFTLNTSSSSTFSFHSLKWYMSKLLEIREQDDRRMRKDMLLPKGKCTTTAAKKEIDKHDTRFYFLSGKRIGQPRVFQTLDSRKTEFKQKETNKWKCKPSLRQEYIMVGTPVVTPIPGDLRKIQPTLEMATIPIYLVQNKVQVETKHGQHKSDMSKQLEFALVKRRHHKKKMKKHYHKVKPMKNNNTIQS